MAFTPLISAEICCFRGREKQRLVAEGCRRDRITLALRAFWALSCSATAAAAFLAVAVAPMLARSRSRSPGARAAIN